MKIEDRIIDIVRQMAPEQLKSGSIDHGALSKLIAKQ